MKITNQINNNDCGVSVLLSLFNHFYKKELDRSNLLNEIEFKDDGISLNELESVAYKYGIMMESYNANLDDIKKLKKHKIFVSILKNNDLLHYVICEKLNHHIIRIYCSILGEYDVTIEHFESLWTGIYIDVSKTYFNTKLNIDWKKKLTLLDWKFLIFSNLLNIVLLICSFYGATFFQNVMKHVIENGAFNNLITIGIVYSLVFLLESLFNYFNKIWYFNSNNKLYQMLHTRTLHITTSKYISFFNKVNWSNIINFDDHLLKISSFYTIKLNNLITDILTVLASSIIISINDIQLLLVIVPIVAITLIIELAKIKWIKPVNSEYQMYANDYFNTTLNYFNYIKANQNLNNANERISKIKFKWYEWTKFNEKNNKVLSNYSLIESIASSFGYIMIVILVAKLVLENKLSISSIALVISLMQMNLKSTKSIISLASDYTNIKISKEIILSIWDVENIPKKDGLDINSISCIKFGDKEFVNDTYLLGKSGCGKTTLLKHICGLYKNDINKVFFDSIDVNFYNTKQISDKVIYLSNCSSYNQETIVKLMSTEYRDLIVSTLQMMSLSSLEYEKLSSGQKQILNFLCLLEHKDKILLLDEILNHVDWEMKQYLLSYVKPILTSYNFVIMTDHDYIGNFFANEVNLNE